MKRRHTPTHQQVIREAERQKLIMEAKNLRWHWLSHALGALTVLVSVAGMLLSRTQTKEVEQKAKEAELKTKEAEIVAMRAQLDLRESRAAIQDTMVEKAKAEEQLCAVRRSIEAETKVYALRSAQAITRLYDDSISRFDDCVRRVVGQLKATGQYENTIVVVTSDTADEESKAFLDSLEKLRLLLPMDEKKAASTARALLKSI